MVELDQYLITTAKLMPYPKRGGSGLARAFHRETDPAKAERGELIVVTEVLAPAKAASEVTDLIVQAISGHYFESLEDPAQAFEEAVKSVNHELAHYATGGNSAWIGKISAVVAVIAGGWVHLTQTGSAQAYLFRRSHSTCITTGLESKEPQRPSKTFGNIASGRLSPGDRLLITTPALLHQLSHDELAELISDNSAAGAINKLQSRLQSSDAQERIAATISEVTTAEAAALAPQSGLPKELHLGRAESFVDLARHNAQPHAERVWRLLKNWSAKLAQLWRQRLQPGLRRATLAAISWLRSTLSDRRRRWILAGVATAVVIASIWLLGGRGNNQALAKLADSYHSAYTRQLKAAAELANGDKLGAKADYQASLDQLNQLLKSPLATKLPGYLAKHQHQPEDPLSPTKLRDSVANQIDQIDGLTKVSPGQLADFSALGQAKPTMMEQLGQQFYFVDPTAGSTIYRYDLTTAKLEVIANHPAKLGKVVAMTTSAAGDGLYLLTDGPAVWFLKASDASLTQLTISNGSWPKGQAIASYSSNLYILAADDSAIYKVTKAQAGLAAPIPYPINDPSVLVGATTLAVDGNIYLGGDKGFVRILAGVVQKSDLSFPSNLLHPRAIVSAAGGKLLIETDGQSNRLGLFSFDGTLQYNQQLAITSANTVYKVSGDGSDNTLYALVDQKFVKLSY